MSVTDLHINEQHFPANAVWVEHIVDRNRDLSDPASEPHRHEFHEILWTQTGEARHVVDGSVLTVGPGSVVVIARRQVHQYLYQRNVCGAAIRFGDELAAGHEGASLVLSRAGGVYRVPPEDVKALDALIVLMDEEAQNTHNRWRQAMDRHLLSALLALLAGWEEGIGRLDGHGGMSPADRRVYERFVGLLEDSYARERGARFYAEAVGVSQATLGRIVNEACGRTVKAVILQRALTEADRLLTYTGLTVGEVAARVGFDDAFYFSRLYKRYRDVSPIAFRRRAHASLSGRRAAPSR